ncbi:MAG: polymerase subunit gamma and tau, partial [Arthrobacter sp.]|nr:polymerase subunit gamma and tau [Arthrobacter sp.]
PAAAAPAPAAAAAPAEAAAVPAASVPAAAAPAARPPAGSPAPAPGPAPAPASAPAQRQPVAAPRISTSDWPVDEPQPGAGRPASGPVAGSGRESVPPLRADQPGQAERPAEMPQRQAAQSVPHQAEPVLPVRPASEPDSRPASTGAPAPAPSAAPAPAGGGDVEVLRRAWPEVLQTLTKIKRSTWALVEPNAQVGQFDGQVLTLVFTTPGLAGAFGRADHSENLRQAIHKTIGIDCQIAATAGASNSPASSDPNPKGPTSRDIPAPTTDADWGLAPADTESGGGIASGSQKDKVPAPAASPRPAALRRTLPAPRRPPGSPGLNCVRPMPVTRPRSALAVRTPTRTTIGVRPSTRTHRRWMKNRPWTGNRHRVRKPAWSPRRLPHPVRCRRPPRTGVQTGLQRMPLRTRGRARWSRHPAYGFLVRKATLASTRASPKKSRRPRPLRGMNPQPPSFRPNPQRIIRHRLRRLRLPRQRAASTSRPPSRRRSQAGKPGSSRPPTPWPPHLPRDRVKQRPHPHPVQRRLHARTLRPPR